MTLNVTNKVVSKWRPPGENHLIVRRMNYLKTLFRRYDLKNENVWTEICGCLYTDWSPFTSVCYVVTHEALWTWALANANELILGVLWVGLALLSIILFRFFVVFLFCVFCCFKNILKEYRVHSTEQNLPEDR